MTPVADLNAPNVLRTLFVLKPQEDEDKERSETVNHGVHFERKNVSLQAFVPPRHMESDGETEHSLCCANEPGLGCSCAAGDHVNLVLLDCLES